MGKKGLKEFLEVYDIAGEQGWLALDLAQNLSFRFEYAKDKDVQEEDVHMAYGLVGMGRKYPHDIMKAIHSLAEALGYTRADYIDGADKRRNKGRCNIHILGEGRSKTCDIKDLMDETLKEGSDGRKNI